MADDSLLPSELQPAGGGGGLDFQVIGAAGERVRVAVVVPAAASSDLEAALNGTVRVLEVVIGADAKAVAVRCRAAGGCSVV